MTFVCAAARTLAITALCFLIGVGSSSTARAQWLPWLAADSKPGTEQWWDANKKKAVIVPGKGYEVPGVDGYFDQDGRPIDAPVDEVFGKFSGEDDGPGGLFPALDPKVSYRRAKVAAGFGPDERMARDALAEGAALYNEKQYAKAEAKLKTAVNRLPGTPVANRAQFLLGECYFFQDQYTDARDAYDAVVAEQPNTRDMDTIIERQWSIAQYWEKHHFEYKPHRTLQPNFLDKTRPTFDTLGQAIKTYESIRLNDPTGPRADDAIMATAGIYFRKRRFHDADYHYSLLRREYPRSEHQFDAHILGLQAKLRKYQGPDYDGTPLEEAQALAKQIRTQFAGRLTNEEKERLRQAQAEVKFAVEQRDLRVAEYYENTEHFGAAKEIYTRIVRNHRGSPVAKQAEQRLAALGGVADTPPTRLAWFVDLFPENRERSRVSGIQEIGAGGTRLAENPAGGSADGGVQPATATR